MIIQPRRRRALVLATALAAGAATGVPIPPRPTVIARPVPVRPVPQAIVLRASVPKSPPLATRPQVVARPAPKPTARPIALRTQMGVGPVRAVQPILVPHPASLRPRPVLLRTLFVQTLPRLILQPHQQIIARPVPQRPIPRTITLRSPVPSGAIVSPRPLLVSRPARVTAAKVIQLHTPIVNGTIGLAPQPIIARYRAAPRLAPGPRLTRTWLTQAFPRPSPQVLTTRPRPSPRFASLLVHSAIPILPAKQPQVLRLPILRPVRPHAQVLSTPSAIVAPARPQVLALVQSPRPRPQPALARTRLGSPAPARPIVLRIVPGRPRPFPARLVTSLGNAQVVTAKPQVLAIPRRRQPTLSTTVNRPPSLPYPKPIPAQICAAPRGPKRQPPLPIILRIPAASPVQTGPMPHPQLVRLPIRVPRDIPRSLRYFTGPTIAGLPNDLVAAAIAWMRGNAPLVAAFGDSSTTPKFFSGSRAEGLPSLPYVVFEEPLEDTSYWSPDSDGTVWGSSDGELTVNVFAATELAARNLRKQLRQVLKDAPLTFLDGILLELRPARAFQPADDELGPESPTEYQFTQTFEYVLVRSD